MTDWKTVYGLRLKLDIPAELDTVSSAFVVYQRRNISAFQSKGYAWNDDFNIGMYYYEERTMTREEYVHSRIDEIAESINDLPNAPITLGTDTQTTEGALWVEWS